MSMTRVFGNLFINQVVTVCSNPWQSVAIRGNTWQSLAIRGNPWQSAAICMRVSKSHIGKFNREFMKSESSLGSSPAADLFGR